MLQGPYIFLKIAKRFTYWLKLPTIQKPAESKRIIVRIRAQYSLVIAMIPFALEILLLNCGVLDLSNKIYF